jgi:hypothetical protein
VIRQADVRGIVGLIAERSRIRRGDAVASSYYEIRVAGVLPPEVLLDFERLTASVEPVETVVHGPLADQAALNGLLARLETFGVEVLELRRLYGLQSPPMGDVPTRRPRNRGEA